MSNKYRLYHYEHCPFCLRVRMAFGYLGLKYDSIVLAYDDEDTPKNLTGVKMLPILVDTSNDKALNESLDIIKYIDSEDMLKMDRYTQSQDTIEKLLSKIGSLVHPMAMPYWIYTKEFNESSRQYFQKKKEAKRGPFANLVAQRSSYENQMMDFLAEFELSLRPHWMSDKFSINDIIIASHLWGLYVVAEFQFPPKIHQYLMQIKTLTNFNYHQDFWK